MAKPQRSRTQRPAARSKSGRSGSLGAERRRRRALQWAGLLAALGVVGGAGYGLSRLEQHVHRHERFFERPDILLAGVPEELESIIGERLEPFADRPWADPGLCVRIARTLEACAWVRGVDRVRRTPPHTIEVRCDYRTPAAMVQDRGEFVLLDAEGVRLPGRYPYSPALPLVQGVVGQAPPAGVPWEAPDLSAGLAVAGRIEVEAFAEQVVAVRVHNFRGREDPRAGHIELATDRPGGRIIWGSAPGEEIEENTVEQKLAILRHNYAQYGRIDANRAVIDVSTFPDGFTTPLDMTASIAGPAERAYNRK